jgi:hypothetical protein
MNRNDEGLPAVPEASVADRAAAGQDDRDQPAFGEYAAQILATEHWSLLGTRSLIWNEALSRTAVFLTLLSASIISIALVADATGFGPHTTALALVLLPVVFLLGLAAYARLVQINTEEFQLVLAMNRLRQAYVRIEPGVVPFLTTGRTDDERGLVATYMLGDVGRTWLWIHFIVNTPTIVGTVDAAIAAVVTVLLLELAGAPVVTFVVAGGAVFGLIWLGLYLLQLRIIRRLLDQEPRFPSTAEDIAP